MGRGLPKTTIVWRACFGVEVRGVVEVALFVSHNSAQRQTPHSKYGLMRGMHASVGEGRV
jgi:hypothetical protein